MVIKNSSPRVSIVIPNRNGATWLPGCLEAVFAQDYRDFEVVVVDNGSSDSSREFVTTHYPQIHMVPFKENRGFAAAVNAGIQWGTTELVALLNTDTRVRADWLTQLVRAIDVNGPEVGYLASMMLDMAQPDRVENAGDMLSWQGIASKRGHGKPASQFNQGEEVFSACAGASLYRRSFLQDIGGFDEKFFAYLEDIDLGLRARILGYRCLFVPEAQVLHQGHGSEMPDTQYVRLVTRNRLLLVLKNIPAHLIGRHLGSLLYGQLYCLLAYRRPMSSLIGYTRLVPLVGYAVKSRSNLWKRATITPEKLEGLITRTSNLPPLRQEIRRLLSSAIHYLQTAGRRNGKSQ